MERDNLQPTIAAIATAAGPGGIGIIRISGSRAGDILARLFRPHRPAGPPISHKLRYGWIVAPDEGRTIDEVLAVFMEAPHTYTREDVVEIHCHSSHLILQEILGQVLAAGARLAEAGEFTKRAFLNGRIDLTEAEAVCELLEAKTREGLQMAVGQLQGGLHRRVEAIRDVLVEARAVIEVAIDFPEDDVEIITPDALRQRLQDEAVAPLVELINASSRGRIFRDGISVVIWGRPNVGKSSLLNALLREERAIVTPVPGTTRDTIEEYLDLNGLPVRLVDTAGIRETAEAVEEIGIRRARDKLAVADLVLFMVDATVPLTAEDHLLFESIGERPALLVINKIDLLDRLDPDAWTQPFAGLRPVALSAATGQGLEELERAVFETMTGSSRREPAAHGCVPNLRQQAALAGALESVRTVLAGLDAAMPADLLAVDLQAALDHLGDVVGETTTEDVLDTIFAKFCLGK